MRRPRKGLIAFVTTDGTRCAPFTVHRSHFAAECHYGDLSKDYRGSSYSDYFLNIYTVPEFEEFIKTEGVEVNWTERKILFE